MQKMHKDAKWTDAKYAGCTDQIMNGQISQSISNGNVVVMWEEEEVEEVKEIEEVEEVKEVEDVEED